MRLPMLHHPRPLALHPARGLPHVWRAGKSILGPIDRPRPLSLSSRRQATGQGCPSIDISRALGRVQQHDYSELERSLSAFVKPGEVFEVRLIHAGRKRIDAGYFDHPAHAATAIAALQEPYQGIYFTPNPVVPDLSARSYNRITSWAQLTTMDPDIVERRWLLVDIDPTRPAGISSTDAEMGNAFKVARTIANMLELEGWPRPYLNASGNGAHLMYAVKLPNNEGTRDEIAKFLKCLDARFSGDGCRIDTTVFNAARIWRVPGTWARKGDNLPTRPHRKAGIVQDCISGDPVTFDRLVQFNAKYQSLLDAGKTGLLRPSQVAKSANEYPEDERKYRSVNEHAMSRLPEWVIKYFPTAREYKQGYRISSEDLGLSYEEDLTIHPWPLGIKYFGLADQGDKTEGRRTPIALLAEFCFLGDKTLAAHQLADTLKVPISEFEPITATPSSAPAGLSSSLPGISGPKRQFDFSKVPSIASLQTRTFTNQVFIIPGILPTGNIMLAARPKMRKTFLALQLGMAVASGRKFLGYDCNKSDVLFLGLEDNERRLKSRIKLLQTLELNPPDLSGFRYWTGGVDISPSGREFVSDPEEHARTYNTFPRGEGGVEALNAYLDKYPLTKLIVIDTLAHFREQSNNRDIYQRDYDQMMPITRMCAEREVLCLVVHHEKKGLASTDSGDFMEDVSGSSGITGAVDGVMSIKGKRGPSEENESRKLVLSGRDMPRDMSIDIAFDAQKGGWLTAVRQDARVAVLEMLKRYPYMSQRDLAATLSSLSQGRISQVLMELKLEGLIEQNRMGYSLKRDFKGDMYD